MADERAFDLFLADEGDSVLSGLTADDDAPDELVPLALAPERTLPFAVQLGLAPRAYQEEAVSAWERTDGRGVVVLPTGAGKTVLALMAAARLQARTLIVVPTLELLDQWRTALIERLGAPAAMVGQLGGGRRDVRPLTVATYDSASMRGRHLPDFGLLVIDEAHHLPAATYRVIARKVDAPYRLGLSATPERADGRHVDLAHLLGPEVYRRLPADLAAERHISTYRERRVWVDLTPVERMRYDRLMAEYRWYLSTRRIWSGGMDFFKDLVRRSGYDPAARRALRAHHEARLTALNADAKIAKVAELLDGHRQDKVIVFSEYTALVDQLSRRLCLPAITYRTEAHERQAILDSFRAHRYSKLVAGRVLNEGVDVPDANVAIVVSGSSATREYVQRLGRVLWPKPRPAVLYELISRRTIEGRSAQRRRPASSPEVAA
jgi:superfamily II DNA or RNA helicase